MERKIDDYLINWNIDIKKKPLVIYGDKQVGKTYSIINFGIREYKNVAYFNAENNHELKELLDEPKLEKVITKMSLMSGETILKGDSLIVIDNVREKDYLKLVDLFYEAKGEYHIIFILALRTVLRSFKTPRATFKQLSLVDFEEYLLYTGNGQLISYIKNSYKNNKPMPFHKIAMELYEKYLLTGGFPGIITNKVENELLNNSVYSSLLDLIKKEVLDQENLIDATRGIEVINILPMQLMKENKKFQYALIKEGARSKDYDSIINFLYDNGFVYKSYKVTEVKWPLVSCRDRDNFKLYLNDTGLLYYMLHLNKNKYYLNPQFEDILIENQVASTLINMGFSLYHYQSSGKAELDFVIQNRSGDVVPIEIVSSRSSKSKSLSIYRSKFNPILSIRIGNFENDFKSGIKYVPYYAMFCMEELNKKIEL